MRVFFWALTILLLVLGGASKRTQTKPAPPTELEIYFWTIIGESWIDEVLSGIHFVNGVLDRENFRTFVYSEVVPVPQPSDEDIEKVFLATDTNSDGGLSAEEISAAYQKSTIAPQKKKYTNTRAKKN